MFVQNIFQANNNDKTQSSALLVICEGNPSIIGGFTSQRASETESVFMSWPRCVQHCLLIVVLPMPLNPPNREVINGQTSVGISTWGGLKASHEHIAMQLYLQSMDSTHFHNPLGKVQYILYLNVSDIITCVNYIFMSALFMKYT